MCFYGQLKNCKRYGPQIFSNSRGPRGEANNKVLTVGFLGERGEKLTLFLPIMAVGH